MQSVIIHANVHATILVIVIAKVENMHTTEQVINLLGSPP
jgi:hypothetical protein